MAQHPETQHPETQDPETRAQPGQERGEARGRPEHAWLPLLQGGRCYRFFVAGEKQAGALQVYFYAPDRTLIRREDAIAADTAAYRAAVESRQATRSQEATAQGSSASHGSPDRHDDTASQGLSAGRRQSGKEPAQATPSGVVHAIGGHAAVCPTRSGLHRMRVVSEQPGELVALILRSAG